jgi:hypothetical protein
MRCCGCSGLAWWERSVNLGSVLTRRGSSARCRRPDRRHRPTAGPRDHLPNGARAMTAQQNDPEVRGRTRFISIARVRRAAQLLRAERHRRDARRHDPGLTRGAADGGLATGAGRELGSLVGGRRAVVRQVLDREPLDQLASAAPSPARTLSQASPPPAGTLTDAELAVQQPGAHAARRHVSADHAGGPRDVFGDGARGRPGTVRGQYRRQRAASSCDHPGCGPGRGPGHCCWHVARAASAAPLPNRRESFLLLSVCR